MKNLRVIVVILALALVAGWWFFAQKESPAPAQASSTKTAAPAKPVVPAPAAVQTPKIGPAVPLPANLTATSAPAPIPDDFNMNVPVIGPAPMPITPGPATDWGEVHFEDGQKVVLNLVTGQPVTITPKIQSNGEIELRAEVHYPTENDLMVLPDVTAKPGEEVTFAIENMDVKLKPTAN